MFFCYRHFGIQYIWEKALAKDGKAPTLFIWVIGIYVAIFGLASNRYENRIDIIENRANSVISQLSSKESRKQALSLIPLIQNLKTYGKPGLFNPIATLSSLRGANKLYGENIDLLKELVVLYKSELRGVDFYYEVYEDFYSRSKKDVNGDVILLNGTALIMANFSADDNGGNTVLTGAQFVQSDLTLANFSHASVTNANFKNASLLDADFSYADVEKTDFRGADGVEFANFACAKNLETAFFDQGVLEKIKARQRSKQIIECDN